MLELAADATLDQTLAAAFGLLAHSAAEPNSAFHTPALATIDLAGAPAQRIVVMRGFDAGDRLVRVHTDQRSAKARELARDPRAALLFYDAAARVQIRLTGQASLHADDAIASAAWDASRPASRTGYAAAEPPGTIVPAPPVATDDADAGRANFLVLLVVFDRLEWLWLGPRGHRRARFSWETGALRCAWLAP